MIIKMGLVWSSKDRKNPIRYEHPQGAVINPGNCNLIAMKCFIALIGIKESEYDI